MSNSSHQTKLYNGLIVVLLSLSSYQPILGQATPDALASAATQFDAASLSAPYPDGFGIPLKSQAVLNVTYPSGPVTLGKNLTADEVKSQPTITLTPANVTAFKTPSVFTLMLADANALGNPDKDGNYRHFLENGATFGDAGNDGAMALNVGSGTVVTSYVGPGPLLNTGVHRYAWMLFAQPSSFHAPSNLSAAGVGPGHWYVNNYVSGSGLGDLVAATFFMVENGHATFPHNSTITHTSTSPASGNNSTLTPALGAAGNATRTGASSSDSSVPVWKDCSALTRNLLISLSIAGFGFIFV